MQCILQFAFELADKPRTLAKNKLQAGVVALHSKSFTNVCHCYSAKLPVIVSQQKYKIHQRERGPGSR